MPMDDHTKDALDALEALITSDGWALLQAFAAHEWGNENFAGRVSAMNIANPHELTVQLAEALAARRAVQLLLQWPHMRIVDLRKLQEGAPALRGQGRM